MWSSERPPCCPTTVFLKQGATRWLYSFLGWRLRGQNCRQLSALLGTVALPMLAWAQSLDVHVSSPAVMGTVLGRTCQLTSCHGHRPWTYMSAHQLSWAQSLDVHVSSPAVMGSPWTYMSAHQLSWAQSLDVHVSSPAVMGTVLGRTCQLTSCHGHSPWTYMSAHQLSWAQSLDVHVSSPAVMLSLIHI